MDGQGAEMDAVEPERRLAQDLLLIAWDDERGRARPFAAANIAAGVGDHGHRRRSRR